MQKKTELDRMRKAIAAFFRSRREDIGWSRHELRQRAQLNSTQLAALEGNADTDVTLPTFLRAMHELGIGMHLTEQNSDAPEVSADASSTPPPFLATIDADARQLYILHWRRPSFLVQVVQTIPHSLRFVATWGVTPAEIKALPVWAGMQAFVQQTMARHGTSGN